MKVIIVTDLEGISLVDSIDMMDRTTEGYRFACRRLMMDVNAAVQGAVDAGADEILVVDGHGSGDNFIPELLDPRATQSRDFCNPHIFDGCAAYLEVGLHAKPGTLNGFLDHVQSSDFFYNYYVNCKTYGELAQGALYCGNAGVPVVMVSGDEAACAEAQALIDGIECAVVKRGIGRNRAECVPSEEALRRIREAAYNGVRKAATIKPFTVDMPAELKLEFLRADFCEEHLAQHPKYTRLDARTVGNTIDKFDDYADIVFCG